MNLRKAVSAANARSRRAGEKLKLSGLALATEVVAQTLVDLREAPR